MKTIITIFLVLNSLSLLAKETDVAIVYSFFDDTQEEEQITTPAILLQFDDTETQETMCHLELKYKNVPSNKFLIFFSVFNNNNEILYNTSIEEIRENDLSTMADTISFSSENIYNNINIGDGYFSEGITFVSPKIYEMMTQTPLKNTINLIDGKQELIISTDKKLSVECYDLQINQ